MFAQVTVAQQRFSVIDFALGEIGPGNADKRARQLIALAVGELFFLFLKSGVPLV